MRTRRRCDDDDDDEHSSSAVLEDKANIKAIMRVDCAMLLFYDDTSCRNTLMTVVMMKMMVKRGEASQCIQISSQSGLQSTYTHSVNFAEKGVLSPFPTAECW